MTKIPEEIEEMLYDYCTCANDIGFFKDGARFMFNHLDELGVFDALKKTIKENTAFIDEFDCKRHGHNFEPDTSMTIMRCENCGIGANTHEAREVLEKLGINKGEHYEHQS